MCRFDHEILLGTTQAKTLRLDIDSSGLNYEVDVPQTREDVIELVDRGDVAHSSIAFQTYEDDWTTDSGQTVRTLLSGRLIDVAPVSQPAYRDTSVALRSLADYANADPADVFDMADRGKLAKLLCRSDRPSDRISAYPGAGHRWRPDVASESRTGSSPVRLLADLAAKRHPDGSPRVGKDARLAYLETLKRDWDAEPRPPKSGRLALIETLGKRWPDEARQAVSDAPWDFSEADYTLDQYRRACLIDKGTGNGKDRYALPVREPDGTLSRRGVHSAAGRLNQVQVSATKKAAAAQALVALYRNELNETPPGHLLAMASAA